MKYCFQMSIFSEILSSLLNSFGSFGFFTNLDVNSAIINLRQVASSSAGIFGLWLQHNNNLNCGLNSNGSLNKPRQISLSPPVNSLINPMFIFESSSGS